MKIALTKADPIVSYVLVIRQGSSVKYWGYGQTGMLVDDVLDARRYARKQSALNALGKLAKARPELVDLKVEEISE